MQPRAYISNLRPHVFGSASSDEIEAGASSWLRGLMEWCPAKTPQEQRARDQALFFRETILKRIRVRRHGCIEDFRHMDWENMRLWNPQKCAREGGSYEPSLEDRMEVFADVAQATIQRVFADDTEPPDYLIQVSCTGYDSPNAAQRLVVQKDWNLATRVLHVGHMGCYAALPSSALAATLVPEQALRAGKPAKASVFLIELCTLHLRPLATDPAVVVQQVLFSDGAIRLDVTSEPQAQGFAVLDTFETILPDSLAQMTWRPANSAFAMTLSIEVPKMIQERLRQYVKDMLARNGLALKDVDYFAVHPGGPKIIEAVESILELPAPAVAHSKQIFADYGNMSSTTIPHIWHAMLHDRQVEDGALICSLAFGPGLTVAGNLLRKGS